MKFFTVPLFLLLLTVQLLAADRWGVFSDPFPIRDAISWGENGVMLATEGGIRYRTPDLDVAFHSESGLETSSFYALVSSEVGVIAVSEFGLIAKFSPELSKWKVLNRSYVANNIYVVPGTVRVGGRVLVIPFEDRLAFFDLNGGNSILTLKRLGNLDLSASPVQNVAIHGDSLYVKTARAVFVRYMPWETLSADIRLSDPNSWTRVPEGQVVEEFKAVDKSKVVVGEKTLKDSVLYDADTSVVKWTLEGNDGYFLVGSSLVGYYSKKNSKFKDLTGSKSFPIGSSYEIAAVPTGGVMVASDSGLLSTGDVTGWNPPFPAYHSVGSYGAAYTARMKVLSILPDGYMFFHVWGVAYQVYSESGNALEYTYGPSTSECLDTILYNYSVSVGVTPAPDNSGFLTAVSSKDGYTIVYMTKDGDVRCDHNVGRRQKPGVLQALLDEDGSWRIFVSSRDNLGYGDEGDVDMFKYPSPKSNGGELANGELRTYKISGPAPLDMAYDSVGGRLWMVSTSNLYYYDEENDTLMTPSSMNGLRSADYTAITTDVQGNLWVSSSNQGAYRLSLRRNSPDTLSVTHYTSKNGLLNDNVLDMTIDPVNGVAWFNHKNGVTYYQRNDLKDARANMTDSAKVEVKAYPVPFRPNIHARFTIEGVSESSVVSLYNRGGALIKSFRNGDLLGGKLEWDGRDRSGKLVAPGVYYYVVNDGSKNEKGKFIIIH